MIRLGMHTDNLRELSGSFAAGVELGAKYNLEHIECGFIDGIMYVQCMGYEPSVSTLENPPWPSGGLWRARDRCV